MTLNKIKFILLCISLVTLVACGPPSQPTVGRPHIQGHQTTQQKKDVDITNKEKQMQNAGVTVIHSGQQSMLVLPADEFFFPNSSHLNGDYYGILNTISDYLSLFDVETIKVAGYSDDCGDPMRAIALSRQQAQNIADYLKNQEIKAPIIYAIGYGCAFPIADNHRSDGREMNRRIQITFYRSDPKR
jgi:outer membrane protein OmpA-like peptidoglycan-associated protein